MAQRFTFRSTEAVTVMPSRFPNLAPHVERPPRYLDWDVYDDLPLDPQYISLAHKDRSSTA